MMNSPSASEVCPGPVAMSPVGTLRVPSVVATTAWAPLTSSAGTESAAGEALARLPPRLDRFWIWSEPIRPAASASPGKAAVNSALPVSCDVGRAAPTVHWPSSWVNDISRSMCLRSTSSGGDGRPPRNWGTRSVAPANTREPGLSASSDRASSTVVGAAYFNGCPSLPVGASRDVGAATTSSPAPEP